MKRITAIVLSVFVLLFLLCGCGKDGEPVQSGVMRSGVYKLLSTGESDSEYVFTPYLKLDSSDGSFIFYYDSLSSYMAYGSYTVEDSYLICETGDGMYTYTFKILSGTSVAFDASRSAAIIYHDINLAGDGIITDGSVFELVGD